MFIQLDFDGIFDLEKDQSRFQPKQRSPLLSVVSEDQQEIQHVEVPHCEFNSSLFKGSSLGSIELQEEEETSQSTVPVPSHYQEPGQRLYYQARHNTVKKLKEIQRWKYEMTQKQKDILTFTPKINKNTDKILSQRQQNPQNVTKAQERKFMKLKEYQQKQKQKDFQTVKQCTFKPKIAKKTEELTKNRKEDVFNNLYHQSKMKQIRQKVKCQPPQLPKSPNGKQAVENFLQRNNQFLERTKKKLTLLEEKSLQYDLNTGQKLFTPKISQKQPKLQSSKSSTIFKKNQSLQSLNEKLKEKFKESVKGEKDQKSGDQEEKQIPSLFQSNLEACFQQKCD